MVGERKRRKHLVPQLMQQWTFNNGTRNLDLDSAVSAVLQMTKLGGWSVHQMAVRAI